MKPYLSLLSFKLSISDCVARGSEEETPQQWLEHGAPTTPNRQLSLGEGEDVETQAEAMAGTLT